MILEEAIRSRDFNSAMVALANGEKFPSDMHVQTKALMYEILIEAKQFDMLHLFVDNKIIETDIYEYDNFDFSFFYVLFTLRTIDEEVNDFFDVFIDYFTNINDEIKGYTLLSYAFIKSANLRTIQTLIDFGCDVNFRNNEDEDNIHQLVKSSEGIYSMSSEDYYQLFNQYVEILVDKGLMVDSVNNKSETALISALRFRKVNLLDVLLKNGANPAHVDGDGNNAFYYAIIWNHDLNVYLKLCEYASPELNDLNSSGQTVLFNYVTEINFDSIEKNQAIIKQLINDGADVYRSCNRYGDQMTSLDSAAGKPVTLLEAILETGVVDINVQDSKGNTLMHKVCAYNVNDDHDKAKETYRKVKLLLEKGADFTLTNDQDQTALMLASNDNYKIKTVELLMKQA